MRVEGIPEAISEAMRAWKYSRERRIPGSSCWDWMSLNWICGIELVFYLEEGRSCDIATHCVGASYNVVPTWHLHAEVDGNWDLGGVWEDEFDFWEFFAAAPVFCEGNPSWGEKERVSGSSRVLMEGQLSRGSSL